MQIEQLIHSMKKRPGMFVKEEKIEYIYYFLLGFCGANKYYITDGMDHKFSLWFGKWLLMWIENNIDSEYAPKTAYWYDDIKTLAKNENNEVRLFYELCEEFFLEYRNKMGYFSFRNDDTEKGNN